MSDGTTVSLGEALALLAELEHMERGEWLAARLARTVVAIHRERLGAEERARAKCVAECDRLVNAAADFGRSTYFAGASDAKIAAYREGMKMCRDALRVLSVSEPTEAAK